MKCPQCQFENPDGSKFRLECGLRFEIRVLSVATHWPPQLSSATNVATIYEHPKKFLPSITPKPSPTNPSSSPTKSYEGQRKLVTVP